jgi:RHS repeat-associated protein
LWISVDAYNHVGGDTYDAAGEVTNDGPTAYTYDAEGRMTAAGSTTYTFDGDGKRVKKSTGTLYWYGAGGSVLAETDASGNTSNEYIFFAGGKARRDGSGNVYFYFGDQIGTTRTITNSTGSLCYDADFYPFGGERTPVMNTCAQNYKFAGMERDPETGNDHTQFRQYASNLGRWMSPDPMGGDIMNPQSLNRYAYVMNNPPTLTDPEGLGPKDGWDPCDRRPDKASCGGGGFGPNDPGAYATDPADIECAYVGTANAGCSQLPGLWSNGTPIQPGITVNVGGTGSSSSGPLSGDYGGNLPPPGSAGSGLPCDFGNCGAGPQGFISNEDVIDTNYVFYSLSVCAATPGCLEIGAAGVGAVGGAYFFPRLTAATVLFGPFASTGLAAYEGYKYLTRAKPVPVTKPTNQGCTFVREVYYGGPCKTCWYACPGYGAPVTFPQAVGAACPTVGSNGLVDTSQIQPPCSY